MLALKHHHCSGHGNDVNTTDVKYTDKTRHNIHEAVAVWWKLEIETTLHACAYLRHLSPSAQSAELKAAFACTRIHSNATKCNRQQAPLQSFRTYLSPIRAAFQKMPRSLYITRYTPRQRVLICHCMRIGSRTECKRSQIAREVENISRHFHVGKNYCRVSL